MSQTLLRWALVSALSVHPASWAVAAESRCSASSTAAPPTVVELYTSEGCSSCPPADRWLSSLKGRNDVLALAFHVNYWDRLGWPDRFASAEYTARQSDIATRLRSSQVYTPQVVVNGQDWRNWPKLPNTQKANTQPAPQVVMQRQGDQVLAQVAALNSTALYSGYFVVLEDQHESKVRAGENAGATLKHDHVVRLLRTVPAWPAAQGAQLSLNVSTGVQAHPRRVVLVVQDAATHKPVQAVALGC
jgi:hypothetical protein